MKKLISYLLTMIMVVSLLPAVAFAEGEAAPEENTQQIVIEEEAAPVDEQAAPVEEEEEAAEETAPAEEAVSVDEELPAETAAPVDEEVPAEEDAAVDEEAPAKPAAPVGKASPEKQAAPAVDAGKPMASRKIKSVSYTSPEPLTGYVGSGYVDAEIDGAVVTVRYTDGTKDVFEYIDEYGDDDWDDDDDYWDDDDDYWDDDELLGWYKNYNYSKDVYPVVLVYTHGRLKEGENECELEYTDEKYDDLTASCSVTVIGVPNEEIASVSYNRSSSNALTGRFDYDGKMVEYLFDKNEEDDNWFEFQELNGDTITVVDVEGETKTYKCKRVYDEDLEWYSYTFVNVSDPDDSIYPEFFDDQVEGEWSWIGQKTGEVIATVDGVEAPEKLIVNVPQETVPVDAEIRLAPGFEPYISIGQDDEIYTEAFFGEGNSVVVHYLDNSTKEYTYDPDMRAFLDAEGREGSLYAELESKLVKDEPTDVDFTFFEDEDDDYSPYVDFEHTVTATRYAVYVSSHKKYQYTGKVIKPSATVKTVYGDRTISSEYYQIKNPNKKKIGVHRFSVTILNTDKYYSEENYNHKTIYGWFDILPKKPVSKKPAALTKGFTAKWTKFKIADQKTIDGFIIEYATKKSFSDKKTKTAKKGASSLKVTKLKSKKTYYVRIYAYKKVTQTWTDKDGIKHSKTVKLLSNPSKTQTIKTL